MERINFQRDFYQLLLDLDPRNLDASLNRALALITTATGAERGYLEIRDQDGREVYVSTSIPEAEVEALRDTISTGIVSEAIRSREILAIPSAMIDPRFKAMESVQHLQIQAVLCVPFFGNRASGVLYIQGDEKIAEDEDLRLDAELFARHVSPLLDSFLRELERQADSAPISGLENFDLQGLICASESMQSVIREAAMVAPLEVTTLLLGDTGTGKTALASAIHANSARRSHPFVEINCAALPVDLIESELFGARKGAHSTALQDREGKLAAADGGTLFLDEIAELPLSAQAKLLQFLQSGEYFALGATQPFVSNVRVIAATNQNLEDMVRDKRFREDLLYRVNTFEIYLPGLAARRDDIEPLTTQFAARCCEQNNLAQIAPAKAFVDRLLDAQLPGNVRQLGNLVERACIKAAASGSAELTPDHLTGLPGEPVLTNDDFHTQTLRFQRQLLLEALDRNEWNVSRTARELELSRSHIHNLIKQFGLTRTD